MIDGVMDHADNHGGGGSITNGDTQWMTAGGGVLHKEAPPEWLVSAGGLFHGLQLWVPRRYCPNCLASNTSRRKVPMRWVPYVAAPQVISNSRLSGTSRDMP